VYVHLVHSVFVEHAGISLPGRCRIQRSSWNDFVKDLNKSRRKWNVMSKSPPSVEGDSRSIPWAALLFGTFMMSVKPWKLKWEGVSFRRRSTEC